MDLHKELPMLHVDAPQAQHNLFDDAYGYGQKLVAQVHESAVKHPNISVAVAALGVAAAHGGGATELAELVITETQQAGNALIGAFSHVGRNLSGAVVKFAGPETLEQTSASDFVNSLKETKVEAQMHATGQHSARFEKFFAAFHPEH